MLRVGAVWVTQSNEYALHVRNYVRERSALVYMSENERARGRGNESGTH